MHDLSDYTYDFATAALLAHADGIFNAKLST